MDTISGVLSHFLETDSVLSYQAFGNGHIHDTYQVKTKVGDFILQRINHHIFKDVDGMMQNIALVAQHLTSSSSYNLQVLSIHASQNARHYIQDEANNYWRCFSFIENTTSLDKLENPEQAYTIAHAFGTFIRVLSDFDATKLAVTIPNFHDGLYRLAQLRKTALQAPQNLIKIAQAELDYIYSEQIIFEEISKLDLPTRVVHNDTKANNILLDASRLTARCVIDLDTVMPGTLLSDFGDMVRICTNSEVEDSTNLEAIEMRKPIFDTLQSGFLAALEGVITETERANLVLGAKWIILEQACRFLTDFLDGNRYYKTEYPSHNLVRAQNQIALYQSLVAQLG